MLRESSRHLREGYRVRDENQRAQQRVDSFGHPLIRIAYIGRPDEPSSLLRSASTLQIEPLDRPKHGSRVSGARARLSQELKRSPFRRNRQESERRVFDRKASFSVDNQLVNEIASVLSEAEAASERPGGEMSRTARHARLAKSEGYGARP